MNNERTPDQRKPDRGRLATKIILSSAALTVGVVHVVWPALKIDIVTLGLLFVGTVPWLDRLFKSVPTPMGNLEFRDEVRKEIDRIEGKNDSTRLIAEANEARDLAREDARRSGSTESLDQLAAEYDQIRVSMPGGGPVRTKMMTSLVGKMISASESGDKIDIRKYLSSREKGGPRLAAYVSLYAKPDKNQLIPLVDSLIDIEDKPFGQYWGLRSLWRIIEVGGPGLLDKNTLRRLQEMYRKLPPNSDRHFELGRILEAAQSS